MAADLPDHSVAISSMCTTKLERFDKIGKHGKHTVYFENEFVEMVSQFLQEIIIFNEIEASNF